MGIRDRLKRRLVRLAGRGAQGSQPATRAAPAADDADTPLPRHAVAPPQPASAMVSSERPEPASSLQRPVSSETESKPRPEPRPDALPGATGAPAAATATDAGASALTPIFADDHATSDAPVRNAHYAETFETTEHALRVRVYSRTEGVDFTFPCEPGEYVLDAAERAGHELPFSCRGGGCIVCAARVDEGEVIMDEQYVLDEDHIRDRFRLLCCTHVTTDAVFESHLEDAVD